MLAIYARCVRLPEVLFYSNIFWLPFPPSRVFVSAMCLRQCGVPLDSPYESHKQRRAAMVTAQQRQHSTESPEIDNDPVICAEQMFFACRRHEFWLASGLFLLTSVVNLACANCWLRRSILALLRSPYWRVRLPVFHCRIGDTVREVSNLGRPNNLFRGSIPALPCLLHQPPCRRVGF